MDSKVEGFIISSVDYGESSLVLQLLTKNMGIIGIMAKGAKSIRNKLHPLTMKYTYGFFYIHYKENKLSILKDVDIINPFFNIKSDIINISYMTYLSDLTYQVYKESNEKKLYKFLISALLKIENGLSPLIITNIIEVKYLSFLGVGLELDCCMNCGNTKDIVTILDGGLLCKNCYQNEKIIDPIIIKLLRLYNKIEINSITKLNLNNDIVKKTDEFLTYYYGHYTGLYLKSKNFLDKLKFME